MSDTAVVHQDQTDAVCRGLLGSIARQQEALGLTNVELAKRVGVSRMTIQRSREQDADPQLSTVVAMALAVGLTPSVDASGAAGHLLERDIVHRGLAHNRLKRDRKWRDTQRETALAVAWEAANDYAGPGLEPVMKHLVPNYDQAQASAAATVLQWLGSDVGFIFLERALKQAGYKLVDERVGR
ncbi:hypothetical protein F6X40_17480 [Paraburkholderia sp. UCT31]|uniref:helix-turn-helix domain-containing protein n=1 Tax=Paraburkholderia sp. UCT31 TaxID=2615209 RepID=UPI0016566E82|nr:helix-turn-helix domain-containing protein [Paraburkholderia sp. UCT31]MBC8738553.1 hypothetical protein [Paraburkholderia sp. UCT31]